MPTIADLKPLSAHSVVVSLLLGAHGDAMTPSQLVAAGEHLGLPAATVWAALSRALAGGDLRRDGAAYRLGARLVARRERQEQHDRPGPWDGSWEQVVVVGGARPSAERAALRTTLLGLRLGELREGVWLRPANLIRPMGLDDEPAVRVLTAIPADPPAALAAALWDLEAWAREAAETVALLEATHAPAERLVVAAHLVRHLTADPLLPRELWLRDLEDGWPGERARAAYAAYEREIAAIARRPRNGALRRSRGV